MTQPRVVMCSMWMNDAHRQLAERAAHLLAKAESYPNLRWVWIVGDSTDGTAQALRDLSVGYPVTVVDIGSTGIVGDDMVSRLRRLSVTANHYLRYADGADYILMYESDITSPANLVNLLVAKAERGVCPVAAWPVINLTGTPQFYDVWAYRKDGVLFTANAPYHSCYKPDKPFVVDSFGTCFMFHAEDAPFVHMDKRAVLDLCQHLREQGRTLWVDPSIVVEQPIALWEARILHG